MSTAHPYMVLADLVLALHFLFVLFVLFGSLLAAVWHRIVWLHLAAVTWGAVVEFFGWICPLTPLENFFRQSAGAPAYRGDFVGHYLMAVLYPDGLTRNIQILLGVIVLAINGAAYIWLFSRRNGAAKNHP